MRIPCKYEPFKCLYSHKYRHFRDQEVLAILDVVDNSIYLMRQIFFEDRREREIYRKKKIKYGKCENIKDYLAFKNYAMKSVGRLSSFVIIGLNTNRLLEAFRRNYKFKGNPAWKRNRKVKKAFRAIKFYRDKIFAHFAYALPRGESESFKVTTLANWQISGIDNKGVVYIGGKWLFLDKESKSLPKDLPEDFKQMLSIMDAYLTFKEIFKSWYKYFRDSGFKNSGPQLCPK